MKRTLCIRLALALSWIWFIIFPGLTQAATFNVNSTLDEVDANIGDCVCLTASQTCTLRAAIQEANACEGEHTINLPSGNYVLSLPGAGENAAATGDLDITGNLTITGYQTNRPIIDANKIDRVFHILGGASVSLSNLVIQNGLDGEANANQAGYGGCVRNDGTLSITDALIQNCVANNTSTTLCSWQIPCHGYGGGIYSTGQLTLQHVDIVNNKTNNNYCVDFGGGIYVRGTLLYESGTCAYNRGGDSGCLHNDTDASATIRNVYFYSNKADCIGAGLVNLGTAVIVNCTFDGAATITAENCGAINNPGTMTVTNSTLSGHRLWGGLSQGNGGAICNGVWGGIANLELINVTINNNSAPRGGGGILNGTGKTVILTNTIIANSPEGGNCQGTITSQGHNLDSGNTCGFSDPDDQINTDPKLGPLQNNGGPTLTHALLSGSPAIDRGDTTDCPATDQRGVSRPKGAGCDIGAYEFDLIHLFLPLLQRG
jgi:CSLREA domain-containing protein